MKMTKQQVELATKAAVAFNVLQQRGEFDASACYDLYWHDEEKRFYVDVYPQINPTGTKKRYLAATLENYVARAVKQVILEPMPSAKVIAK